MGDVPAEAAGHEPDDSAAEGRNGADAADDERRHAGDAADAGSWGACWGAAGPWRHEWDGWDAAWGHGREPDADDDAADGE